MCHVIQIISSDVSEKGWQGPYAIYTMSYYGRKYVIFNTESLSKLL